MYRIFNHGWDSKKDYDDYKKYLMPKLHKILDKGYSVKWDGFGNWVTITKSMGNYKAPEKHCFNMIMLCQIKCFRLKSTYGINDGRISKMWLVLKPDYPSRQYNFEHQIDYFNYDRGSDVNKLKKDKKAKKMYDDIIRVFG